MWGEFMEITGAEQTAPDEVLIIATRTLVMDRVRECEDTPIVVAFSLVLFEYIDGLNGELTDREIANWNKKALRVGARILDGET